MYNWTSFIVD